MSADLSAAHAEALQILLRIARSDNVTQARLAAAAILRIRPPAPPAAPKPPAARPATTARAATPSLDASTPHPSVPSSPSLSARPAQPAHAAAAPKPPTRPAAAPGLRSLARQLLSAAGAPLPTN